MRKVRALQVGTAAGAVLVAMMLSVPAAQAACGDYGQPPCPTPTVTPQPPAPSPSPSPRPTASPSATPTPLVTPEPVETTNPEAARVIDGSVVVVSQQTAENTPPRLILQPLSTSVDTSQVVVVQRVAPEQIIAQFLSPKVVYVSQILVNGKWSTLGTNTTNAKGQLVLPAMMGVQLGTYPVRLVAQPKKNVVRPATRFFQLTVVKDKAAALEVQGGTGGPV